MAQECTLVYKILPPIPFTCANGTGIAKGAILKLTDPMTVALADGDQDYVAGIAAEEKIANDGKTKIAVWIDGVFKGTAGATGATAGQAVMTYASTGDSNDIVVAAAGHDKQLGIAYETAANNETFLFRLLPMSRDEA